MASDLAAYDLRQVAFAGALHDPVAALMFCSSVSASYVVINGRVVVRDQHLTTLDLPVLLERHNRLARQLLEDRV